MSSLHPEGKGIRMIHNTHVFCRNAQSISRSVATVVLLVPHRCLHSDTDSLYSHQYQWSSHDLWSQEHKCSCIHSHHPVRERWCLDSKAHRQSLHIPVFMILTTQVAPLAQKPRSQSSKLMLQSSPWKPTGQRQNRSFNRSYSRGGREDLNSSYSNLLVTLPCMFLHSGMGSPCIRQFQHHSSFQCSLEYSCSCSLPQDSTAVIATIIPYKIPH